MPPNEPGPRRAITSLADLESRIRRLLRAAGEIGTKFSPDLYPVLVAGDLTSPGCNDLRGRKFAAHVYQATPSANTVAIFQAQSDLVVTAYSCDASSSANLMSINLYGPNDLAGHTATTLVGTWAERPAVNDYPPVLTGPGPWGAFTAGAIFRRHLLRPSAPFPSTPCAIFLPAGAKIGFYISAALTEVIANIEGYVF